MRWAAVNALNPVVPAIDISSDRPFKLLQVQGRARTILRVDYRLRPDTVAERFR